MELNSCVCVVEIYFSANSQGNKKIDLFSQESWEFQILGNETLIIAGTEISIFHQLAAKLWLKEDDDLHKNNP